jgi:hypothetical protein
MAGGKEGSRFRRGETRQEKLRKMISSTLQAANLSRIDHNRPERLASITTILPEALDERMLVGHTQERKEARKEAEDKAVEKKRPKDERSQTAELSPRSPEKKIRKDQRNAIRKEKLKAKKREEARKKLPMIAVGEEGIPTKLTYNGARGTIKHIISSNFARGVEWSSIDKKEQERVIGALKDSFQNGGDLDSAWIADKICNSMAQSRYHDRMKIQSYLRDLTVYRNLQRPAQFTDDIWKAFYQTEVQLKATQQLKAITEQLTKAKIYFRLEWDIKALEEKVVEAQAMAEDVGNPPPKFLKAAERVKTLPNTIHRLGQGGIAGLKAAFVSILCRFHVEISKVRTVAFICQSSTLIATPFAVKYASQHDLEWRFGVLICDSLPGSQEFQMAL